MSSLLTALRNADSSFPSGGIGFSGGIEGLVSLGQEFSLEDMCGLFGAVLRHRWASCERVALVKAWRQGGNIPFLLSIDEELEASTLPAALREGSRANGAALLASHSRIGSSVAPALQAAISRGTLLGHLPVVQAVLWKEQGVSEMEISQMSGYTTLASLSSSSVRLGVCGALLAQKVIGHLLPLIGSLSECPVRDDQLLSGAFPWLDVASAWQEIAPLRLFAN